MYDHLAALERHLSFPVHRVYSPAGKIQDSIATGKYEPIPWFVPGAIGRRQCTKVWKLYPIRRKVRELLGGKTPRGGCEMLIGISSDEIFRMKPSTVDYITMRSNPSAWATRRRRPSRADAACGALSSTHVRVILHMPRACRLAIGLPMMPTPTS